ncbi:hypothetical protein VTH82DRAFT_8539 [Thermothelomyces myriococcoides]
MKARQLPCNSLQ